MNDKIRMKDINGLLIETRIKAHYETYENYISDVVIQFGIEA